MPSLITLIDGTIPVAADFNGNYTALNNAIGSSTAISTWGVGELPYASATDTLSRLSPGSTGKVLTMTSTVPNWEGGVWVTPAFSAGDFTAGGSQTWTVDSGDVLTYAYLLIGKTMHISFTISTTTVAGTPNAELRLIIPAGKTAAKVMTNPISIIDNGGAPTAGICVANTGITHLKMYRDFTGTANWTASTNATQVQGQIFIEIQ